MPQYIKRKILKYLRYITPIIIAGILLSVIISVYLILKPVYRFCKDNNLTPKFFISLLSNSEPQIKKYQDRTNIVLLGIGDKLHEGFDLTDTIIFLSIDFKKGDAVIVSIPRDIWLITLKDRINSAYHYGEKKQKGSGMLMAKAAAEEVVGQPVHYAWVVDFSGFKRLIDLVGGVDVNVEREFTDKLFPIEGKENDFCGGDPAFTCRYEKLHFTAGWNHMDGATALKFVRSRYADGEEGTDFARGKRQQQVIVALKDKLIKTKFWTNLKLTKELFNAYTQITNTDMNWSEQIILFKFFLLLPDGKIRKAVLDTGDEKKGIKGFLVNPPLGQYNGAWVLVPRTGDFDEIHKYISCQIETPNCQMKP